MSRKGSGTKQAQASGKPAPAETHRGAFGEFGGEQSGLIDRSYREQILLVGMKLPDRTTDDVDAGLDEMEALIDTVGADTVDRVIQRRQAPDPATFVGKGKANEIYHASVEHDADTVVFDDELNPAQQANLEKLLKRSALDRTAVILDIFAQNAASAEGKAQVELAQLKYRLPRLAGRGGSLSQQAGGIGTRGPGETQLEVDRRRIQRRLAKLEKDIDRLRQRRALQRKARRRSRFHTVSIVGYTNAGKSSLLNRLTGAGVVAEDRLFATLDATTRQLALPGGETVLLTDTVGFIKKLPTTLIEAFKSTLEEVAEADLLLHVVDASAADPEAQIEAVRRVLREIGCTEIDEVLVFNKIDAAEPVDHLLRRYEGSVACSVRTGDGIDDVLNTLADRLRSQGQVVELRLPFDRGDLVAAAHREGVVLAETHTADGISVRARLEPASMGVFEGYVVTR